MYKKDLKKNDHLTYMEHETIDFDINNYTLKDLEYFFKLETIENYTFMHIESQANIIQNQILNHHTFNADEKTGFIHFIQQGKQRLMSGKPLTRKKYILNIDSKFRPSEQEEAGHLTIDLNKETKSYTNIRCMKISAIHLPPNLLESHDYIFVRVDDFQENTTGIFVSAFHEIELHKNLLARVGPTNDHVLSEPRIYTEPIDLEKLEVFLCDEKGEPLEMKDQNISMCITLEQLVD